MIARDEWQALSLFIEEWWPGEFTDATARAWRVALDDYDAAQVLAALKTILAKGERFRPAVSEVIGAIRRDPSKPTFEEAFKLIFGPGGVMSARVIGAFPSQAEMGRALHQAREARARECHPLVASFCLRQGLDRLSMLELDDTEWGEKRRSDLCTAWERHCEAMEDRDVAQLVAPRGEGLRALDPLAALDGGRRELEARA